VIVRSNTTFSRPRPKPGDEPQVWVDVNVTPPTVRLLEPVVHQDAQHTYLILRWKATGNHLAARPITLSYAPTHNGPWLRIGSDLENTGEYRWRLRPNLTEMNWLRLQVTDASGNVVTVMGRAPGVTINRPRPEGTIIGVEPAEAH
jgi:hypothetical protein